MNIIGNIVVFIPFGILFPVVFPRFGMSFKKFAFASAAALFFLECMQILLRVGVFDVDDIILNMIGISTGYVFFINWYRIVKIIGFIFEFCRQEALSCIFPASVFIILALSKMVKLPFLPRYDFILILCIIVQVLLVVYIVN